MGLCRKDVLPRDCSRQVGIGRSKVVAREAAGRHRTGWRLRNLVECNYLGREIHPDVVAFVLVQYLRSKLRSQQGLPQWRLDVS